MKSSIQKLPKSKIELEIEIPAEEFNGFIDKATLNLGKELEIEGFRKGNAPKEIIQREIGLNKILTEAANRAVKESYIKALSEHKIEVISQPEIEIIKLAPDNPLIFKARTLTLPEINLPDYKKIASEVRRREVSVQEQEIGDALKWLQKSRAKFTLKTEPCQKGDFVEIELSSPQLEGGIKKKDNFILGEGHFIPGFEDNLKGMTSGQEKEFSLKFPGNHYQKTLAGKEINFKVKVNSVQKVELPAINNQFVQSLGNFPNLDGLKKSINEGLTMEKKIAESQRVRQEILKKIAQLVNFEIPEVLVNSEKKYLLEDLKARVLQVLQINFEEYLAKAKKTEKEILESFLPEAQKRIKESLILREISKQEKIEATEEEVREEVNKILRQYHDVEKAKGLARQNFSKQNLGGLDPERLKGYTKEVIVNEKTFQLLESFVK